MTDHFQTIGGKGSKVPGGRKIEEKKRTLLGSIAGRLSQWGGMERNHWGQKKSRFDHEVLKIKIWGEEVVRKGKTAIVGLGKRLGEDLVGENTRGH